MAIRHRTVRKPKPKPTKPTKPTRLDYARWNQSWDPNSPFDPTSSLSQEEILEGAAQGGATAAGATLGGALTKAGLEAYKKWRVQRRSTRPERQARRAARRAAKAEANPLLAQPNPESTTLVMGVIGAAFLFLMLS